ncbi:amidohydrolase [Bradyrhizobium sp. CCBAU 53421]|uniref:amidohydrolase family protein n=1 Tax=Bradyrhizobium sp. CCBAU 53421 TaxID=1325120 RepID=UPI001AEE0BF3|nr:amidohydrolase family protein [Bradyrhizobium sp. CCBAU 53421]
MRKTPRYLLGELLADLSAGHDVRATVHLECGSMYREAGAIEFAPVGETEFANGIAVMAASDAHDDRRPCAGIAGYVDLALGSRAAAVLEAHVAAGAGRFRGVRQNIAHEIDINLPPSASGTSNCLYGDTQFRAGFRLLAALDLSFDAWLLEPQLPELIQLARAFPETSICLDHVGTPLGTGWYVGKRKDRFQIWRANIEALAECKNVYVKLGGLAMHYSGFPSLSARQPVSSAQLAEEWGPYLQTCVEAFSPSRAMFESNFPVDALTCDYATLWNAFKRFAARYSATEKNELFFGTAARFYRLQVSGSKPL